MIERNPKTGYFDDWEYIDMSGIIRLIEGIILNVLDKATISAKWYSRPITERMVIHKMNQIVDVRKWLDSDNCDTWLHVYSQETGRNPRNIKKSLRKSTNRSMRFLRKLKIYNAIIKKRHDDKA